MSSSVSNDVRASIPKQITEGDIIWAEVQIPEVFKWLENVSTDHLSIVTLQSWMALGTIEPIRNECKIQLKHHNQFCDNDLIIEMDNLSRTGDLLIEMGKLSLTEHNHTKRRYNPFQKIERCSFRTRVTVKAANLDSLIKFTNPLDQRNNPLISDFRAPFRFSDIYGHRDGFVEYIKWRLTKLNKISKNYNFKEMCGNHISENSITTPGTIEACANFIRQPGFDALHFVAVDYQPQVDKPKGVTSEVYFKQLSVCNCAMGLSLLGPNGTFVMKMYKSLTLFTVGLLYLMYRCFDRVTIIKPNSCLPNTAERYLVCKWKKPYSVTESIRLYLIEVNAEINRNKGTETTVMQVVPLDELIADQSFFKFIYECNMDITIKNIKAWRTFLKINGNQLADPRQDVIKHQCLRLWDIDRVI